MPDITKREQRALSAAHVLGDRAAQKRAVSRLRASLAELTEANLQRVQELFNDAARESPAEALRLWLAMMEFVVPKLSRTEVEVTDDSGDVRALTMDALQAIVREERERDRERAELESLTG